MTIRRLGNPLFGGSHAHDIGRIQVYTHGKVVTTPGGDPAESGRQLGVPQNDRPGLQSRRA
ncbi:MULTISPECIES: hypothetical protein [unclassified Nesterenkonia]|uniref:hypothetical protein n=1 Tax=unclassified Nesterenkonia TaxID=2629769 RepID=UPI001F4CFFDE|nr:MULTISPECIES: hypothetical protein [unclassified Nesterenkonia]MCH8561108.1 hypothetical protein [Nesterenkonia sp. DZ6]MCH8562591.1 hypothetical protein [Nesterenkonia sp. YGD6]